MTVTFPTTHTADVTWTTGSLAGLVLAGFATAEVTLGPIIRFPDLAVSMAPLDRTDDELRAISDALAPETIRAAIRAALVGAL